MAKSARQYVRPTDDDLRVRVLEIDDPHVQPGLVNHIPPGVDVVGIINTYSYSRWPQDKAYCSKCEGKRHKHGFTAELDDGTFALLGSRCGAKLWGQSWHEAAGRFKEELDRAGTILGFDRMLPELRSIREALESWRPTVDCVAKHQKRFIKQLGFWFYEFRTAAVRHDHRLVVHENVRDYAAEAEYEQRYGDKPPRPFYKSMERTVHSLEGGAFFATENLDHLFELALEAIDAAFAVGSNTILHSQMKLREHRAKVRDARDWLERLTIAIRALRTFYENEHLGRVSRWMETVKPERTVKAALDFMKLPPDYRVLDTEPLRRLQKL
jgi:hypothetical protein